MWLQELDPVKQLNKIDKGMTGNLFWDKYAKYIASTKLFKEKDHKKMITEGGWAILEKKEYLEFKTF